MAQQEIIQILKESKRPMSRTEIARAINITPVTVSHCLNKMIKYRDVKVMEIDRIQAFELYRCKRRMRLYYL